LRRSSRPTHLADTPSVTQTESIPATIEQAEQPPRVSLAPLAVRGGVGGVLMGLANLVPGISGGTMLLAAGVYPRFIAAIGEVTTFKFRTVSLVVLLSVVAAAGLAIVGLAGPVRALVVEDDADQADMAASFLRLRRIEPLIASDGWTGLELAAQERPDLILLDLMLPDLDGFDVCRRLRAQPGGMARPIVMVTALHGDAHRRLGFRVGANAYLTKPYGPSDLYQAIDAALAWRDDRQRQRLHGEIEIEINSASRFLQEVNTFLIGLYRGTPLTTNQIQHLQQAVLELGQNAIEWGNQHQEELPVQMTYRVFEDRVEIQIRDQGAGYDPQGDLPHTADPADPIAHLEVRRALGLREGGFGLLITRGMVDELNHNQSGNEVTLIKRFPAEAIPSVEGAGG